MKNSDLFILPSRWEGFGHVIVEAMACSVPVLAAKCPSGPDEIITDGVDGLLCKPESAEDMAEKIKYLLNHPGERKRLSVAAKESAKRFDSRIIVKQYKTLFHNVLKENH